MIKCYHARKGGDNEIVAPLIAVIDGDYQPEELIWDCCNNSCWWDGDDFMSMTNYKDIFNVKFTPDYRGYCNDDLIIEMENEFYVALPCGWKVFDSFEDAFDYCRNESYWVVYDSPGV